MKDEEREIRDFLGRILENETYPVERQRLKFELVKRMKKNTAFADNVAIIALNKLRNMKISQYNQNAIYNVVSLLVGSHGVPFSGEIRRKINAMRKWTRWNNLSEDSPLKGILQS